MSLSATLSSALSGLTATSRAAEIVSSNIANAKTEGYGRRGLELTARQVGASAQGVEVVGVTRRVNQSLLSDRRVADAGSANSQVAQVFYQRIETLLGNSDQTGSLQSRVAGLDAALVSAAARPEAQANLSAVLDGTRSLTQSIATAAKDVQAARAVADRQIAMDVETVNTTLRQIAEINNQITALGGDKNDPSALMDQRQNLVDQIAAIIPLREAMRERGTIALYTASGAVLLEGKPAQLGFTPVGTITPDMTQASGALSGLTLNGRPMDTGGPAALLRGGSLAANFQLRDEWAVSAQAQLDAVARNLVERFQDPALDPTLLPGAAGLFTDLGAAFVATNEEGLAQRLQVNAAVDPAQGGGLWRLRDGIGATIPGPSGHSALLGALQARLAETQPVASGSFLPGGRSFGGLATDLASHIANLRLTAEQEASFTASKATALRETELSEGVDTDQELQWLLDIERMYSANAKVIQSVDEMLDSLLRL